MISEEEKRWLYVGLALNKTLVPELQSLVGKEVAAEYQKLKGPPHHIDTQAPAGRLNKWPRTAKHFLNYVNINGNDGHKLSSRRYDYSKFTYQVSSDVDFAKLFLQPHMAKFSKFAECDASALLNLLCFVPGFSPATQSAAAAVRDNVRNEWAHCRFKEWDAVKFADCFNKMEQLIKSFNFAAAQEVVLLGKLNEWETKGGAMIAESLIDSSLITMAMKDIALLKNEITLLDAKNTKGIDDLNALSLKLSELVKRHDLEIGSLNERMDTKDIEVGSLNERMETKDMEVGSLKRRMDSFESLLPSKQLCTELEITVKEHNLEIGSLNERMDTKDVEVGSLNERMDNVESSLPSTKLCTDDSVKKFTSRMRDQVLRTLKFVDKLLDTPDISPTKVDDIYTNMVIQIGRKKDNFHGKRRSEILSAYPDPERSNVSIERAEDLFMPEADTEDPKLIFIRGRAGIGKTLFCQMLARDWAKERLFREEKNKNKFEFVFLFTFRQLNSINVPLTLYDFLRTSPTCPEMTNDTFQSIINSPEKSLLIFDGFDEFRYQQEMRRERVNIVGEKMTVATLVAKLGAGELLANATVVITSRPEAEGNIYKLNIERDVEMLGFNKNNVKEYVNKYFNGINSDRRQLVLDCILGNENIATFCYVPINCFLVCSYVEHHLNKNSGPVIAALPTTIAELYLKVIEMFLRKHHKECRGQENPHLSDGAQNALDKLCELSLALLRRKIFMFSDEDLKNYGIQKEEIHPLLSSGLLHCISGCRTEEAFNIETYYCFLHLTLQEFLAACRLIKSGEIIRLKRNTTEEDVSEMVYVFIAGLLGKLVGKCGKNMFGLNVTNENADKIMSSLTEKADAKLLVRLLYAYRKEQFVKNVLRDRNLSNLKLFSVDSITCQAVAFLLMMQLEDEQQVKNLELIGGFNNIDFGYIVEALRCENCQLTYLQLGGFKLCVEDAHKISDALTSPSCHLTKLDLLLNQIGDKGAEHCSHALINSNCHLTELSLYNNQIGVEGAKHFSDALVNSNCHLTKLDLTRNQIGDKGAEHFRDALISSNCHLTELSLYDNQIGDEGAEHFRDALVSSNCHLTKLDLALNKIGDEGAEHFSHALISSNCHLTKLSLGQNQIGDKGAEHFSNALISSNCHLTKLDIGINYIGDKGAEHFSNALISSNCHLTKLDVSDNEIGDKGAEHFSNALISSNCHLTKLDLGINQIGDKGAEHFSKALISSNCHLTWLHLGVNQIGDKGAEHLSHALTSSNCHLTWLYLPGNQIGDNGAKHLRDAKTATLELVM